MRLAPLLTLLCLLVAAPAAHAWRGACRDDGGPTCTFSTARVVHVHDGDTIEVRQGGRNLRVRITGIQAMEMRVYSGIRSRRRGACHAVAATNRLEQLLGRKGRTVRLGAQDQGSRSGRRVRRTVAFRRNGRWVDAGRIMVAEGHVLWLSNPVEWAWNGTYAQLAEEAQGRGRHLWNPDACGTGPGAGIEVRVNWDADGVDVENPNGEWIRVLNRSGGDVALGGWRVRDSALREFAFPPGAVVRAGGSVTVYVGRGQASGDEFFWGQSLPVFENVTGDGRGVGDGGYLFDPQGDLRAFEMYR